MKHLLVVGATFLLAVLVAAPAWAESPGNGRGRGQGRGDRRGRRKPPSIEQIFERFDANGDGILTEDEVPERVWKRLQNVEGSADAVTKEELEAHRAKRRQARKGRGGDGDGERERRRRRRGGGGGRRGGGQGTGNGSGN